MTWLQGQPDHGSMVHTCTTRDTRWDWQVDDRYRYLARLLHDLRLDPAALVAQLRACGPYRPWPQTDPTDDASQFNLAVGVLEALARKGNTQAHETLRGYVRDGVRCIDALDNAGLHLADGVVGRPVGDRGHAYRVRRCGRDTADL
ncbi:hypothetical protein [Micromonospora sp. NBRC 107095]|uniref:hypothetical protein n=1 Tax=Micromonospora sp. NBRC 107095 TaxID=3032209 RepID=UPI0024A51579|nr:hypothetical protein [Micromonospora sp. NBRC 107095]GLZ62328.1 hypothetical protein Misp05_59040 [Micromonospora sp. NBRC 107095]